MKLAINVVPLTARTLVGLLDVPLNSRALQDVNVTVQAVFEGTYWCLPLHMCTIAEGGLRLIRAVFIGLLVFSLKLTAAGSM